MKGVVWGKASILEVKTHVFLPDLESVPKDGRAQKF